MRKMSKQDAWNEFASSSEGNRLKRKKIEAIKLEKEFRKWVKKNEISCGAFGKQIWENSLEGGVDYTIKMGLDLGFNIADLDDYGINNSTGKNRNISNKDEKDNLKNEKDNKKVFSLNFSFGKFKGSPFFVIILILFFLILLYQIVGPVIYDLIVSGVLVRIIMLVGAVVFSGWLLLNKSINCPFFVRCLILFTIWIVLLNV